MLNITSIPAQRVPFLEAGTGTVSRPWFLFLQNLFVLAGSGGNIVSLADFQLGPVETNTQARLSTLEASLTTVPAISSQSIESQRWARTYMNMGG